MSLYCLCKAVLHLVVWYSGPGQHNNHSNVDTMESGQGMEDVEEDQQALINLERNIANLERSMSASQLERGDTNMLGRKVSMVESLICDDMHCICTGWEHAQLEHHQQQHTHSDQDKILNSTGDCQEKVETPSLCLVCICLCRTMAIKSVKNALSFGRRKSVSEEQNLLGSSMETDGETEDETGAESQEEMEKIDTKRQR